MTQSSNKLAAIRRLCAALEIDPADVLPDISEIRDGQSRDGTIGREGELSERAQVEEEETT